VATLRELREALFPGATVVQEATDAQDRTAVSWVRVVRARTPALDVLEAGDLVIVPAATLPVVAPGAAEAGSLADALARAPAAGVLLLGEPIDRASGRGPDDVLATLEAAVIVARLPAYRVARADPASLERRVIGFLVNRRAEIDRQATELEDRLHELALAGADAEDLTAATATSIGRAIALEDQHGAAIAVHAPTSVPGAAAAAAAYLARARSATIRVSLPGGAGTLVVLGDDPLGEVAMSACHRIAPFLALELDREEAVRRARDLERRAEALPAAGPPWVVVLARQGAVDEADTIERREELRSRIRRLAPARRIALRGDARSVELRVVAATEPDDPAGLLLATRIGSLVERTVAVSEPFVDPAARPPAEAEARGALDAADALPEPIPLARADRIAAYRLIGAVHNAPDAIRNARSLVTAAARRGRSPDPSTVATLRAVLDHSSPGEAAAALGVHRNTILYRTRAIERRTGWDLSDPELRLALAIAVRLVQSEQES
jgi:hypothetical protein